MHFFFLLMHNDPLALSCTLAFLGGRSYSSLRSLAKKKKKLFLTTTEACVRKVTAKDKNSVLGYHLTRVSVTYAEIGVRYLLSRSMCLRAMCCVLCLRGFREHAQMVPSSLSFCKQPVASGRFRVIQHWPHLLLTWTWDWQQRGPEVIERMSHQEGHSR